MDIELNVRQETFDKTKDLIKQVVDEVTPLLVDEIHDGLVKLLRSRDLRLAIEEFINDTYTREAIGKAASAAVSHAVEEEGDKLFASAAKITLIAAAGLTLALLTTAGLIAGVAAAAMRKREEPSMHYVAQA